MNLRRTALWGLRTWQKSLKTVPRPHSLPSPPASETRGREPNGFRLVLGSRSSFEMLHPWFPRDGLLAKGDWHPLVPGGLCASPLPGSLTAPEGPPSVLQGASSITRCSNPGEGRCDHRRQTPSPLEQGWRGLAGIVLVSNTPAPAHTSTSAGWSGSAVRF